MARVKTRWASTIESPPRALHRLLVRERRARADRVVDVGDVFGVDRIRLEQRVRHARALRICGQVHDQLVRSIDERAHDRDRLATRHLHDEVTEQRQAILRQRVHVDRREPRDERGVGTGR